MLLALSSLSLGLDEGDDVSVRIAHVEVEAAPRLSDEPLGKIHAARLVFLEERFHVCHLDRGQDQRASRAASSAKLG